MICVSNIPVTLALGSAADPRKPAESHPKMTYLLSVSASRGPVFRRYLLNRGIYQNKTWAQGVSAYDLIFHNILLQQQKNQNFRVLPLAPNVKNCDMAQ